MSRRYALDDLRLFKALDEAGMEGRVTVTDRIQDADAVIATAVKRTGKTVSLKDAKSAAVNAGIPFLQLRTISAVRVMEALSPLMGIPIPQHLAGVNLKTSAPELISAKEVGSDGGEQLLAMIVRLESRKVSNGSQASNPFTADAFDPAAEIAAWRSNMMDDPCIDDIDVNEDRLHIVPRSKFDQQGIKYRLLRPQRPGSKKRRQRLRRKIAELPENAPW